MKILLSLFTAIIMSTSAFAQTDAQPTDGTRNWEISGGANISFTNASASDSDSFNTYSISGEVDHFISPQLELGLRTAVSIYTGDEIFATNSYAFLAGLTYNFSDIIESSFYAQFWVGVDILHTIDVDIGSPTYVDYILDVGKRFPITSNITYRPEFGLNYLRSGDHTHTWEFVPLQFSFIL
jgi:hypothetical protein